MGAFRRPLSVTTVNFFRDHAQLHPAIKRDWMRVANLKSRSARQRGNNMLVPYQANLQKIRKLGTLD